MRADTFFTAEVPSGPKVDVSIYKQPSGIWLIEVWVNGRLAHSEEREP